MDGPYAGAGGIDSTRFLTPQDTTSVQDMPDAYGDDLESPLPSYPGYKFEDAILRLKEDYRQFHAKRLQRHKADEAYFTLDYYVPTPAQDREPLKAPTAFQLTEELISHIIADIPVISVMPRSKDKSSQTLASKQTAWATGYWRKVFITRLLRKLLWFYAVRGCGVVRVICDDHTWPKEPVPPVEPQEPMDVTNPNSPELLDYADELVEYIDAEDRYKTRHKKWKEQAEERIPIKVDVIDPQWVLWEPSDDPSRCVITWDRTVDEVMLRHPETEEWLSSFKPGTKVTWCEYWDDTYVAYWLEPSGTSAGGVLGGSRWVLHPTKHDYGFFPIVIDGPWRNPLQDADKMYPSIYFAIRSLLQYESSLITNMAHLFRKLGWPALLINTENAYNDQGKPKLSMTPGSHNYLDVQEQAHYLELGSGTMSIMETIIGAVDEYIQDGTGMRDVMRGQPKGKSGYQQAQVASQARVALVPVEQAVQQTIETTTRFIFRLIRYLGEKVTVMSAESGRDSVTALGPKDCEEVGIIKVRMKTLLPIEDGAKIKAYESLLKDGILGKVDYAREIGIDNPEDKVQAAQVEQFENMPPIAMAKALVYVQKNDPETWALMQQFGLVQKLLQQMEGGGQPPPDQGKKKGGKGQPGKPKPPAAPGSAEENGQTRRQGNQGGQPPSSLPEE